LIEIFLLTFILHLSYEKNDTLSPIELKTLAAGIDRVHD